MFAQSLNLKFGNFFHCIFIVCWFIPNLVYFSIWSGANLTKILKGFFRQFPIYSFNSKNVFLTLGSFFNIFGKIFASTSIQDAIKDQSFTSNLFFAHFFRVWNIILVKPLITLGTFRAHIFIFLIIIINYKNDWTRHLIINII